MFALFPDLLLYLSVVGGAIALWLTNNIRQRAKARKDAETDALKDSVNREKRGRDAVTEEQSDAEGLSNSDLVERMRRRHRDPTGL